MISVNGHKVYRKVVHNKRNLDPRLTEYLEDVLRGEIHKVKLLIVSDDFWRWELEGLGDRQLAKSPTNQRSTFFYLKPVLSHLWPDSLLRVCKKAGCNDLILDFKKGNDLFKRFTKEEIAEADAYRWVWESGQPGPKYCFEELKNSVPGPIIIF